MRRLLSLFLYGFLLDAVLSVMNEWLPISPVRNTVAGAVFALGLGVYVIAAFTTRLPKRFVLPAVAFLAWAAIAGGFPLGVFLPGHALLILEWSQLVLAVGLLLAHQRWRRTPPDPNASAFSWGRLALFFALAAVFLPLAMSGGAIEAASTYLEARSGGYFKLRPGGLMLEEREFTKDDKQVRLVSMMHIGDRGFYEGIHASLPANDSAIVLLEGISDEKGLLESRFSYSRVAQMLGLSSQENSAIQNSAPVARESNDRKPETNAQLQYRHADVDVSVLSPTTIAFINAVGVVLGSPSFGAALKAMSDPASPFQQEGVEELVMADIVDTRNAHLMVEIDDALKTSPIVIVPWGALHLPFIEEELKRRGFEETRRTARPVVRFWNNGAARPAQ